MYSDSDLSAEVKKEIERALESGRIIAPEWIVHHVLSRHVLAPGWAGEDRDFYWLCATMYVRNEVTRLLRDYKMKIDLGKHTRQPGFAFLQRSYMIDRKGHQRIVPLVKMSQAEGLQKIAELFAMAGGAIAHARELMRFFGFTDADLAGRAA